MGVGLKIFITTLLFFIFVVLNYNFNADSTFCVLSYLFF